MHHDIHHHDMMHKATLDSTTTIPDVQFYDSIMIVSPRQYYENYENMHFDILSLANHFHPPYRPPREHRIRIQQIRVVYETCRYE